MSVVNVIQLRQALAEKFPQVRMKMGCTPPTSACWSTGLPQIDDLSVEGGLPRGALTEIICGNRNPGGATLACTLVRRAAQERQIVAFVDGADSLDVTAMDQATLSQLVWVRAGFAERALKAADLILRDSNFSMVVLDLAFNIEQQLLRIPASVWYRFQRLIEATSAVCLILTPHRMVAPAKARITLESGFSLTSLEGDTESLLSAVKIEVFDARHSRPNTSQQFA